MANANAPLPTAQLRLNVPIVSPIGTLVLVNSSSQVTAIGPNQNRRGVIFVNPVTNTAKITLVPSNQNAVSGQGVVILPGAQEPFIADPSKNIAYNCGWNAICDTGSNVPLEVLELL